MVLPKWILVFTDHEDAEGKYSFSVGPFDTNNEAVEFMGELGCNIDVKITLHAWIGAMDWISKPKRIRLPNNKEVWGLDGASPA